MRLLTPPLYTVTQSSSTMRGSAMLRAQLVALARLTGTYPLAVRVEARRRALVGETADLIVPLAEFAARVRRSDSSVTGYQRAGVEAAPQAVAFPEGRYLFLHGNVPPNYAGRETSILRKARLFKQLAGINPEIVLVEQRADLVELTRLLRDRGELVDGLELRQLADCDTASRVSAGVTSIRARSGVWGRMHTQLDCLVGDDRVFVTCEDRGLDRMLLAYENPNVKKVFLLHNSHLKPPFLNPQRIDPLYEPVLMQSKTEDRVVFLTSRQRHDAELVFSSQNRFWAIPHFVPSEAPTEAAPRDPYLVVVLARLDYQKRLGHAIKAFAKVVERVPRARLEIYGEGPQKRGYQRLIDRLSLRDSVRLMGYTRSPASVLQHASLSLLTSRFEGFPLVLLESVSQGCPIVAYDVRYGSSEVIVDGINGLLVPSGDISALAARMVNVLTDSALQQRLGDGARASAAALGPEAFVARWSALFASLALDGQ